jgi:DNA-binding transcriptional LysR family regulator
MELRHLRYLLTVVEERSISRAAARLNMSQPPLSTAIAQLERELGVKLLERHARGVEPTEAGTYLVEQARELVATMAEVSAAVVAVGTGRRGHLAVAAVPGSGWELLPSSLETFSRDRPEVEIEIADVSPTEAIERVRSRRADAGLVQTVDTRYIERLHARDLEVAMVRREPLVAVMPRARADQRPLVELADLAGERWLLPADAATWPDLAGLIRDAWHRAGISPPAARIVATLDTAVHLVGAGFGVALMPASVGRIAPPTVVVRPLRQHLPPIESAVVWRRNERPSPVLAQFLRAAMSTPEPDRLGPSVARPSARPAE